LKHPGTAKRKSGPGRGLGYRSFGRRQAVSLRWPTRSGDAQDDIRRGSNGEETDSRSARNAGVAGSSRNQSSSTARCSGDEVLALDGLRIDAMSLGARLQEKAPGSTASLTVFRRDELLTLPLAVESGPPTRLALRPFDAPSPEQRAMLDDWLREDPATAGIPG
jgi:hypothetical protein